MRIGTRSLLFGVHQFLIHPVTVALAWRRLYGWPRLGPSGWWVWLAFVIHDWGYFGKPNMDGAEGELHPEVGARIIRSLSRSNGQARYMWMLGHSRWYARRANVPVSRLCPADKLAFCFYPRWLYLVLARASGELAEYKYVDETREGVEPIKDDRAWFKAIRYLMLRKTVETKWEVEGRRSNTTEYSPEVIARRNYDGPVV